jgi:uncharacterized membrane protein YhaH (DUF805 family)
MRYIAAANHQPQGARMNFTQAISSGFSNYVNFAGRSIRSEYWYWALFVVLGSIVARIIDAVIGIGLFNSIFGLAVLLPSIAVGVRRLHDLDRTGWWLLLDFIPVIGWIVLIVWFCGRGTVGANRFGPDPLGAIALSPRPAV